jgi:hypothetical protein
LAHVRKRHGRPDIVPHGWVGSRRTGREKQHIGRNWQAANGPPLNVSPSHNGQALEKKTPMSTLPIAAIAAASAAQHSPHEPPPTFVLVYCGIAAGGFALAMALGWVARLLPAGKLRYRMHMAAMFVYYPFALSGSKVSKPARDYVNNLFKVWRKTYVGTTIVILKQDGTIVQAGIGKTRWEYGDVIATLAPPLNTEWWFKINVLIDQGGQILGDNLGIFTPERWAEVEPELRANAQKQQHAAFSKEIMDALAVLGLTPAATLDEVTDARNRLMQAHHPDHGGSTAAAQRINAAHDFLRSAVRQAA